MSEQKLTYSQRVLKMQQLLINCELDNQLMTGKSINLDLSSAGKEKRLKKHLTAAKRMVKEQAKAISNYNAHLAFPQSWTDQYLIDNGYAPKPQEGGNV